jgi:hypothetical protein
MSAMIRVSVGGAETRPRNQKTGNFAIDIALPVGYRELSSPQSPSSLIL